MLAVLDVYCVEAFKQTGFCRNGLARSLGFNV
jgi:hypothetical protein